MDIAISVCYKMRDMLLFSIYNGVVVCVILLEMSIFCMDDWLLSICSGEQVGNDGKQHVELQWESMCNGVSIHR
jgi:hypothetical protein